MINEDKVREGKMERSKGDERGVKRSGESVQFMDFVHQQGRYRRCCNRLYCSSGSIAPRVISVDDS